MTFSTLDLGYKVRRAKLDQCEGLKVFAHDLDSFFIPIEDADRIASAYRRYLAGAGVFTRLPGTTLDVQQAEADQHFLKLWCKDQNTTFEAGEFDLATAIDFVWFEAIVPKKLAIRWCMMMEFIIWQDQRLEERDRLKKNEAPPNSVDSNDRIGHPAEGT